jgi:hypothetical protein
MAPGVPDSPVSETAQSTVAAASVAEIAGRRQEVELPRGPRASEIAAPCVRRTTKWPPAQRAKRAINLAWAPPSMSCRGPLAAGVKATSPADRAIRRIPATRHRRLR